MTLQELIKKTILQTLKQLRVSMPVKVEKYNATKALVDVSIIQKDFLDGIEIDQPIITEIPVSFLQAGGALITIPIKKGDTGLVIFTDRDISEWVETGNTIAPQSERLHALSDAIFIPGIQGGGFKANDQDVLISYKNSEILLKKNGNIELTAGSGSVKISGDVSITGALETTGNIDTLGNLNATGSLSALSASITAAVNAASILATADVRGGGGAVGLLTHTHISNGPGVPTAPGLG